MLFVLNLLFFHFLSHMRVVFCKNSQFISDTLFLVLLLSEFFLFISVLFFNYDIIFIRKMQNLLSIFSFKFYFKISFAYGIFITVISTFRLSFKYSHCLQSLEICWLTVTIYVSAYVLHFCLNSCDV